MYDILGYFRVEFDFVSGAFVCLLGFLFGFVFIIFFFFVKEILHLIDLNNTLVIF